MDHRDVLDALNKIQAAAGDPEAAHALEDDLYERVLRSIADDAVLDARAVAAMTLLSRKIDFPRWTA